MSAKPYDQAFKFLAEQDPQSLLILLGWLKPGQAAQIELLPRELSVSTRLPDQPYRVTTDHDRYIIHIEAQLNWEKQLPQREADYGARLCLGYRLPVISFILLLTPRGCPKRVPTVGRIVVGDVEIKVRLRIVKLWRLLARLLPALKRESLLPFVPLRRGGRKELAECIRQLNAIADEQRRRDLSLHFLLLGGLRYNPEELLDLLGRYSMIPLEQLKESSFYRWIVQEGLKEGREEGEIKGAATALRMLIAKRFPNLQVDEAIDRIRDASLLQQLCVEVIEIQDEATLQRRLTELAQPSR